MSDLYLPSNLSGSGQKPPLGAVPDSAHPSRQGLVGRYLMNEGAGTTIQDDSRNNTGVFVGTPAWVPGRDGPVVGFSVGTDSIQLPAAGYLSASVGTIAIWLKPTDASNGLIFYHYNGGNRVYIYSAAISFNIFLGDSGALDTGVDFVQDVWQQAVLCWDGTSYFTYLNGVLAKTDTYTGLSSINPVFYLGNDSAGSNDFVGLLSNCSIYNRCLDADEVLGLYLEPYADYSTPLYFESTVAATSPYYYQLLKRRIA